MMIHLGKALDVATQEEINTDYFNELTFALDEFYAKTPQKARLDKAIIAEMIGRVGPKPKIKKVLNYLLSDKDENIRQFSLQSLEYSGTKRPATVLPYIDKYKNAKDNNMVTTAAYLTAKLLCAPKYPTVLQHMEHWCSPKDSSFLLEVLKRFVYLLKHGGCQSESLDIDSVSEWVAKKCPTIKRQFNDILKNIDKEIEPLS